MRFTKTPKFVTWLYPKRIWAFSKHTPNIYLTFDDGPIPEVTPWVLDTLDTFNAKATFFCIGDNIQKHPEVFNAVIKKGHTVGNHTQYHTRGMLTPFKEYINQVETCEQLLGPHSYKLFRPPYGRMTPKQARKVNQLGYTIAMWDVLPYDWDHEISPEKCLQNVSKNIQPGSVIVFHDSIKAEKNLRYVLPRLLEVIHQKGWQCLPLTDAKV